MTASFQQINLEVLQEVITHEPLSVANERFGTLGVTAVKNILRFFRRFTEVARVNEKSVVTVFTFVEDDSIISAERSKRAEKLHFGMSIGEITSLVIEIRPDGTPFVWDNIPGEITNAEKVITYRLLQGVETFQVAALPIVVPKVIENSVSQFLFHYFETVKEALCAYRDKMARTSTSYMLREVWFDENRLWFKSRPEFILRRSLCEFLRAFLRYDDLWLRPEQNVDESHPVDIKIMWKIDNREAIIEVKWIGKSRTKEKQTGNHGEGRARKGAKQLAEYLEALRQESSGADARGYLVVFDCRRKDLKLTDTTTTRTNGMYFANREVKYEPAYHEERDDFEKPIRMFLEPQCV
jgi:hypothetical protein